MQKNKSFLSFSFACFLPLCLLSCKNYDVPEGFVLVESGTFKMGSTSESANEKPVHTVKVDTFFMMQTEVTQKLYQEITGVNPSYFQEGVQEEFEKVAEGEVQELRPVENVSWYDALVFCNLLSERDGLKPCYSIKGKTENVTHAKAPVTNDADWNNVRCNWNANGYRLPTEAEWEFAALGGNMSNFLYRYSGSSDLYEVAWYRNNSDFRTHEVAKKKPNELGLFDMSGNVFELCWDWLHSYLDNKRDNPHGPYPGTKHVERGGGWSFAESDCSVKIRYFDEPYMKTDSLGFRVVRRP